MEQMTMNSSFSRAEISRFIDIFVDNFRLTKDQESIEKVIKLCYAYLQLARKAIKHIRDDDFDIEVVHTFLSRVVSGRSVTPSGIVLLRIANRLADEEKSITKHTIHIPVLRYRPNRIESILLFEEAVNDCISGLSEDSKIILMYLIKYQKYQKQYVKNEPTSLFKILNVMRLLRLKRSTMSSSELGIKIPVEQSSRIFLLASLYKQSPAMLTLMLMTEDLTKFFQFLALFEGTTIEVPKLSNVFSLFERCSNVISNLENDSLSLRDREALAVLATEASNVGELNDKTQLTPFLDKYFEKVVETSFLSFEKIHDKLIDRLEKASDEKIRQMYTDINKEMTAQIRLIKEIVQSVATTKDLSKILDNFLKTKR